MNNDTLSARYVQFASKLIAGYGGNEPFHLYIKKYFRENPRHGSRDRKRITSLCYRYFRTGNGIKDQMELEKKVLFADNLLSGNSDVLGSKFKESASGAFNPDDIFPFRDLVSPHIDLAAYNRSYLFQPLLFLRIRPGFHHQVLKSLQEKNIEYKTISKDCIAVENTTNTDYLANLNKEIVIQDINSQNISLFFERIHQKNTTAVHLWDACAGSGGKSILATDFIGNLKLTVSDIRSSILKNLKIRLKQAGIGNYHQFTADLTTLPLKTKGGPFDVIVADVPCSGSGTWARTPERMYFFKEQELTHYTSTQQSIVSNCLPELKPGGYFLYITCSVFKAENEDNVDIFCNNLPLRIIHRQYLKGYNTRADTLYACLMRKD